jgi:hypothetical protein
LLWTGNRFATASGGEVPRPYECRGTGTSTVHGSGFYLSRTPLAAGEAPILAACSHASSAPARRPAGGWSRARRPGRLRAWKNIVFLACNRASSTGIAVLASAILQIQGFDALPGIAIVIGCVAVNQMAYLPVLYVRRGGYFRSNLTRIQATVEIKTLPANSTSNKRPHPGSPERGKGAPI